MPRVALCGPDVIIALGANDTIKGLGRHCRSGVDQGQRAGEESCHRSALLLVVFGRWRFAGVAVRTDVWR